MKAKTILCCLLISALVTGTAAMSVHALSSTGSSENNISDQPETTNNGFYFEWDRSDENGLTANMGTSFEEAVIIRNNRLLASTTLNEDFTAKDGQITIGTSVLSKLDNGENTLDLITFDKEFPIHINVTDIFHINTPDTPDEPDEPDEEPFVLWADNTDFEWDRADNSDIVITTNSFSDNVTVKSKLKIDSSLIKDTVTINNGQIIIDADFLKRLDDGENNLELYLKEGKLDIKVTVTDSRPSEEKELSADKTTFTWDRSNPLGIAVKTNSSSRSVRITKDGEELALNKDTGVYIALGRVVITSNILKNLDDGSNSLVLYFDDGELPIEINVTDTKQQDPTELIADQTDFEWRRSDPDGIIIQTNSASESFIVKKNGQLFDSSLTNKGLSIEEGQIYLSADFLKKLDNGENQLSLMLKEGNIYINITVIDDNASSVGITADENYYTWDRSNLIGISIKTNSESKNVVITKDGEELFSNKDAGVYLVLGRVGITAPFLNQLDNGENHLVFEFDDGTLPITINVTDRKNKAEIEKNLTADRTVFTWKRGSDKGISVNTNSTSETASVRKKGMLSLVSSPESISIENGTVTLTPAYLNTLSDGKSELTLVMEDGSIDITVNVLANVTDQSDVPQASISATSSSGYSYDSPNTGNEATIAGVAMLASAAIIIGTATWKKKKKKDS